MTTSRKSGRTRRPLPALLAIATTMAVGWWIGTSLNRWTRDTAFEQRPTSRLIDDLQRTDSPFDRVRHKLWPMLPDIITAAMPEWSPMPSETIRTLAAIELRRRAPQAVEAIPALTAALRDPNKAVRERAMQALGGFGKQAEGARPEILAILDSATQASVRAEAIKALAAIAPEAVDVRERLVAILRETAPHLSNSDREASPSRELEQARALRSTAVRMLGKVAGSDPGMIRLLLEELARGDAPLVVDILAALERIGPGHPDILPAVMRQLRQSIGRGAPEAKQFEDRAAVAIAALRAVATAAETAENAAGDLIDLMQHADPDFVPPIVQTLGVIGGATPAILPVLTTALDHDRADVRSSAIGALGSLGWSALPAVPALARLLEAQLPGVTNRLYSETGEEMRRRFRRREADADRDDGMPWTRGSISMTPPNLATSPNDTATLLLRTLARLGPDAAAAAPALERVMRETHGHLRYEAALTLWQVNRDSTEATKVMIEGLNIPPPYFSRRLAGRFRQMGADDLPILLAAMNHLDAPVRAAAMNSLAALGPVADPALPALGRMAQDPADPLRDLAARTLAMLQADSER